MLFDRHRSMASDGFTAARNGRCQFTHAPGLANQAMPHAAESFVRPQLVLGRGKRLRGTAFPRATP